MHCAEGANWKDQILPGKRRTVNYIERVRASSWRRGKYIVMTWSSLGLSEIEGIKY